MVTIVTKQGWNKFLYITICETTEGINRYTFNNRNLVFQERDGSKCLCALGVGPFPLWQWVISGWYSTVASW